MRTVDPDEVVERWRRIGGGLILVGESGSGKSTLASAIVDRLPDAAVLHADPGPPLFGPPGAVALGRRRDGEWAVLALEGLGTLDAIRFRLPLVDAVARLARSAGEVAPGAPLVVDAPGVLRGPPAEELLTALARATDARAAALLVRGEGRAEEPVGRALVAAGLEVLMRHAPEAARPGTPVERARRRTRAWDRSLASAILVDLPRAGLPVVGLPPPADDWRGRQAVLLDAAGRTLALAEAESASADRLRVRCPPPVPEGVAAVRVRDARRGADGHLHTAPRLRRDERRRTARDVEGTGTRGHPLAPRRSGRRAQAVLMGGLFGDPMLHLRPIRGTRSLLFDLGACAALPSRIAHQVEFVFASHAHMDHFAGFAWLLRRRAQIPAVCHVVGPPGTARRVASFLDAFSWDRVGEAGPRFRVGDFDGDRVRWTLIRAGPTPSVTPDGADPAPGGRLFSRDEATVRAAVLDHGIPVLAFRYEDPGQSIVYATDLADTPENRAALATLARGADLLVCEAHFVEADAARARATRHLTARACAEIAREAGVDRLVPFHFSVRYQDDPEAVYREIRARFPRVIDLRP